MFTIQKTNDHTSEKRNHNNIIYKIKLKIQFSLKIHRKTRLVGKKLKELINDVQSVIRISNVIEEALKAN